jgi:hypothetical protein
VSEFAPTVIAGPSPTGAEQRSLFERLDSQPGARLYRATAGGMGTEAQTTQRLHGESPFGVVCVIMAKTSSGAQTVRRSDAGPVRLLLGGLTSPAALLTNLNSTPPRSILF